MPVKNRQPASKEPGALLRLAAAQIDAALVDAESAMEKVSSTMLAVAAEARSLHQRCLDTGLSEDISTSLAVIDSAAAAACTRLQFADFLHQRLSNVRANVLRLANSLHGCNVSDEEWAALLLATRDTFTIEAERRMFDATFAVNPHEDRVSGDRNSLGGNDPILFDGTDDA